MLRHSRPLLLLLPLFALSCHCKTEGVRAAEGLAAAPWGVDFGTVSTGSTSDRHFPLLNDGNAPLAILSERVVGDEGFEALAVRGRYVPSGGSLSVLARFSPVHDGPHRAVLTYRTDAPETPAIEVVLEGLASSPIAAVTPSSCRNLSAHPAAIRFGTVPLEHRATRTVVITNRADVPCTLLSAQATSDGSFDEFSLSVGPTWPALLAPAQSVSLELAFAPTSGALPLGRHGLLTVATADLAAPSLTVDLEGRVQNPGYAHSAWPKWHADNANTGLSFVDTSANRGQLAWSHFIGLPTSGGEPLATLLESPVVGFDAASGRDRVYQLETCGCLEAIDGPSGASVWKAMLTPPAALAQESTPTLLADGSIFVSTGGEQFSRPQLFHVGSDGTVLWSLRQDDGFDTCPGLGLDGTLYLFDDDTPGVEAFATTPGAATPSLLWASTARQPSDSDGYPRAHVESFSAALTDEGESLFTWGGLALAFSSAGHELWNQQFGGGQLALGWASVDSYCGNESRGAPALTGATAAVAYGGFETNCTRLLGGLAGVDLVSGEIRWTAEFSDRPDTAVPAEYFSGEGTVLLGYSSPALLGDGGLVLGYLDGVYAFDPPASGRGSATQRWHFASGLVLSSPAVGADGTVYVGSSDGNFYALDGLTGQLRWKFTVGAAINSSPAIGGDGSIYFAADDGNLYALR